MPTAYNMEENNNGNPNPENGNAENELDGLDSDALKEKLLSERNRFAEVEGKNRQLFERLKKEQGFERDPDDPTNWIKHEKEVKVQKKSEAKPEKSGGIDYGLLSFFNDKSDIKITHDEDVEFLEKEMESSGKPMLDLLKNKYFLSELKEKQDERMVKEATPSSTGRASSSKKDISYWLQQDYNKVPAHLKNDVLDAIKAQEVTAQHKM